jgi:hypothetical protein
MKFFGSVDADGSHRQEGEHGRRSPPLEKNCIPFSSFYHISQSATLRPHGRHGHAAAEQIAVAIHVVKDRPATNTFASV